jgi:hypothetical protein
MRRWDALDCDSKTNGTIQEDTRAGESKGRLLFVNKKKQKNFCLLGRAGCDATGRSRGADLM